MQNTRLKTGNYNIHLVRSATKALDEWIAEKSFNKIIVFTDENVLKNCWPELKKQSDILGCANLLTIPAGEKNKEIVSAIKLWKNLVEIDADRQSLWINFGGGVVSDLGAFVASTFKRGIKFVNIPTTLLAMVDASIGSKTGINFGGLKNQIGLFSDPEELWIQLDFLKTLEKRHMVNGWAEMLKHALIADRTHWNKLKQIKKIAIDEIADCLLHNLAIKQKIVLQDPFEKNVRKKLNFGHSMGHAIESWSLKNDSNPLLHGEAIAIGMLMESYLSVKNNSLSPDELEEIKEVFKSFFPKYHIKDAFFDQVKDFLFHDKKKDGSKLNFTFVSEIGNAVINQNIGIDAIYESIHYYIEKY
jgi:3-dehydroquinate synthase